MDEVEKALTLAIRAQIKQYRTKVSLSAQSFSVSELVETLKEINAATQKPINSIYGLRHFLERSAGKDKQTDANQTDKSEPLIMYTRWFLDNLSYLRQLRDHFTERIYSPLNQIFNERENSMLVSQSSLRDSKLDWESSDLYNSSNLKNVKSRLKYLLDRLGYLLENDGEIDPALFSITSAQVIEELNLPNSNFIRLLPDVLQKMSNAALLSERWLELIASKDDVADKGLTQLSRVKTILTDRLSCISYEIQETEYELDSETNELQDLLEREDRANIISNKSHNLEVKIETLNIRLREISQEIKDIRKLRKTTDNNEKFTNELKSDLMQKQRLQEETIQKVKILQFERDLIVDDLNIEMEIKPSIIRLTNSLQDKCEHLESSLEDKKAEKQRLEMTLQHTINDNR